MRSARAVILQQIEERRDRGWTTGDADALNAAELQRLSTEIDTLTMKIDRLTHGDAGTAPPNAGTDGWSNYMTQTEMRPELCTESRPHLTSKGWLSHHGRDYQGGRIWTTLCANSITRRQGGLMTFWNVGDEEAKDQRFGAAGLDGTGLYHRAGSWIMAEYRGRRDLPPEWFIPEWWVSSHPSGKRSAGKLVKVGLWQRVEGGYTYAWIQPSNTPAAVMNLRKTQRDRQAEYRRRQAGPTSEVTA